ncbi:hypothetical protein PR202_ga20030 [Eleusine coracana subsp. coracana]|uniref:Uncharacterized protein n=1 Tax=Eleusine coracana subsp. coracana TaxID=191504 RepID=A0AAV5CW18_ELECO|nr:hypothetical protein PR202_ga20030 [Eleusine coracana subsp. coracana]
MPKLNFLRFNGEFVPLPWLNKCESYFRCVGTLETEKVWLADLHLDDVAAKWFLALARDNIRLPWADFAIYVNLRFGPVLR